MRLLPLNLTLHAVTTGPQFMGVCLDAHPVEGQALLHRRIDIRVWPEDQFVFALLYFTGSDELNKVDAAVLGLLYLHDDVVVLFVIIMIPEFVSAFKQNFIEPARRRCSLSATT